MKQVAIKNFDLNMDRFKTLSPDRVDEVIDRFVSGYKYKQPVDDMSRYYGMSGWYLLVLRKYNIVYVGYSDDLYRRVRQHISNFKSLDRLVYLRPLSSSIPIDSFSVDDIDEVYVYRGNKNVEKRIANNEYADVVLNRVFGGVPESVFDMKQPLFKPVLITQEMLNKSIDKLLSLSEEEFLHKRRMDYVNDDLLWPLAYYAPINPISKSKASLIHDLGYLLHFHFMQQENILGKIVHDDHCKYKYPFLWDCYCKIRDMRYIVSRCENI